MTAWRMRRGVKPQRGSWVAAFWFAVTFLGAGTAFVCTVPLVARVMLARAADGFSPGTLAVERVVFPRRYAGARGLAYGRLADGSEARLVLDQGARRAFALGTEARPRAVAAPVELQVMVNPQLAGTWLHRQRVQWPEADLRRRAVRQAVQLAATMLCSLAIAAFAWHRLRPFRAAR